MSPRSAFLKWSRARSSRHATFWWWLSHCVSALVAAWPLSFVAAEITRSLPGGDARLFDPGGAWLIGALRLHADALGGALRAAVLLLITLSCLKLIPLCALVLSLNRKAERPRHVWTEVPLRLPSFALLYLLSLGAHALLVFGWLLTHTFISTSFETTLNEPQRDLVSAAGFLLWLVPHAAVQIVLDLAQTSCAKLGERALPALLRALELGLRSPFRLSGRWCFCFVLGYLAPIGAALLSRALDVSQPGSTQVWALLLVHQLAIAWLLLMRVGWLGLCSDAVPTQD